MIERKSYARVSLWDMTAVWFVELLLLMLALTNRNARSDNPGRTSLLSSLLNKVLQRKLASE
jgi:hypothetical protein